MLGLRHLVVPVLVQLLLVLFPLAKFVVVDARFLVDDSAQDLLVFGMDFVDFVCSLVFEHFLEAVAGLLYVGAWLDRGVQLQP